MKTPAKAKPRREDAGPIILKLYDPSPAPYGHQPPSPHYPSGIALDVFVRRVIDLVVNVNGGLDEREIVQRLTLCGEYAWVARMLRDGTAPNAKGAAR